MTLVTSGELRLWVERIGDPADPAVLLIAGAESQGIGWPSVLVDRLAAGGLQVIWYDHRDTGQSDSVDFDKSPYSMVDLVEDAVAVLDGLQVESAHVVGASMGGVIAQWLAATHPDRVLSLILMSTTAPGRRDLPPPDASFLARSDEITKLPRGTDEERVEADVQVYELMNGGSLPFDEGAARNLAQRHFARARDWAKSANHHRIGESPGHGPHVLLPRPPRTPRRPDPRLHPRIVSTRRMTWMRCPKPADEHGVPAGTRPGAGGRTRSPASARHTR
jgi:pimeloyl-ACP methyl ester carboxylesterase